MSYRPSASSSVPHEILDVAARLAASLEKLTQRLEFALAIETDTELQSVICQEAAHESCALALAEGGPTSNSLMAKSRGRRGCAVTLCQVLQLSICQRRLLKSPRLGAFIASRAEFSGARRQAGALVSALQDLRATRTKGSSWRRVSARFDSSSSKHRRPKR